MEISIKQRLITFIKSRGLSIRKFESTVGLSNGYINQLRHAPSNDKLSMILDKFPEINKVWLMTGEGEMLKPSVVQNNKNGDNIQGQSVKVNKSSHDELVEIMKQQMRSLNKSQEQLDKSQDQLSKSQEQIDRLLAIIENFQSNN